MWVFCDSVGWYVSVLWQCRLLRECFVSVSADTWVFCDSVGWYVSVLWQCRLICECFVTVSADMWVVWLHHHHRDGPSCHPAFVPRTSDTWQNCRWRPGALWQFLFDRLLSWHFCLHTWLKPCCCQWRIVHRLLVCIQLCLVLLLPSSSSCTRCSSDFLF